jgi:hypothetical protein
MIVFTRAHIRLLMYSIPLLSFLPSIEKDRLKGSFDRGVISLRELVADPGGENDSFELSGSFSVGGAQ